MIGWTRRNDEAKRRRARWYNSLTPEEQELEDRYQAMVDRKFFPLFFACLLGTLLLAFVGSKIVPERYLAFFTLWFIWLPFVGPFFFIPTSRTWKAQERARSQRKDT